MKTYFNKGLNIIKITFFCFIEIDLDGLADCQFFKSQLSNITLPSANENEWYFD